MRNLLWAAVLAACSAPAPPPDLTRAERFEHDGKDREALAAYERATVTCLDAREKHLRDAWCGAALRGRAETLERLGRLDDAAAAYEAVPARVPLPEVAAPALAAAARVHLAQGRDVRAYELLWKVVTEYPDEAAAGDALRHVVRDGRTRSPTQLAAALDALREPLRGSELEGNVIYALAQLARDDLADDKAALAHLDDLVKRLPGSPFFDDAAWEAAALARKRGDPEGALRRLHTLLDTKETAYVIGSYHSAFLDDALLMTGVILRDDLARPGDAAHAFERLPDDYPDSTLRDDALWELARTREALGETNAACRALATLEKKFPDSRYELEQAPGLRDRLSCP